MFYSVVPRCFSSHPANVLLIGQPRIMQPRTISLLSLPPRVLPFYRAREGCCVRTQSTFDGEGTLEHGDRCIRPVGCARRKKVTGPWKVTAFYLRDASPRHDRESNRTSERLRWFVARTREEGGTVFILALGQRASLCECRRMMSYNVS